MADPKKVHRVVTSGTVNGTKGGVAISSSASHAAGYYRASALVRGTGDVEISISGGTATRYSLDASVFKLIACDAHLTTGTAQVVCNITEAVADSAITFEVHTVAIYASDADNTAGCITAISSDNGLFEPAVPIGQEASYVVAAWMRADRQGKDSIAIMLAETGLTPAGGRAWLIHDGSGGMEMLTTAGSVTASVSTETWHHVAIVHEQRLGLLHLYVDGDLNGSLSLRGFVTLEIEIGADSYATYDRFGGYLGRVTLGEFDSSADQSGAGLVKAISGDIIGDGNTANAVVIENGSQIIQGDNSNGLRKMALEILEQ